MIRVKEINWGSYVIDSIIILNVLNCYRMALSTRPVFLNNYKHKFKLCSESCFVRSCCYVQWKFLKSFECLVTSHR